jgi:hypothetical protein
MNAEIRVIPDRGDQPVGLNDLGNRCSLAFATGAHAGIYT